MAQDLPAAARQLQTSPPFADQAIVSKIVALIEQRSALTARRLREGDAETEDRDPELPTQK